MEILALWLVADCVISRDKHRARGDYNKGSKFQNGCLALRRCYQEVRVIKENSILKSLKDATNIGVPLLKNKKLSISWLNFFGNWLLYYK